MQVDTNGIITSITGGEGDESDGILAVDASVSPQQIVIHDDEIYVLHDWRIRVINSTGYINTVVGYGGDPVTDGAIATSVRMLDIASFAIGTDGSIYVACGYEGSAWKVIHVIDSRHVKIIQNVDIYWCFLCRWSMAVFTVLLG